MLKEFYITIIFVCARLRSGTPGKNLSNKEWGDKARVWDYQVFRASDFFPRERGYAMFGETEVFFQDFSRR